MTPIEQRVAAGYTRLGWLLYGFAAFYVAAARLWVPELLDEARAVVVLESALGLLSFLAAAFIRSDTQW